MYTMFNVHGHWALYVRKYFSFKTTECLVFISKIQTDWLLIGLVSAHLTFAIPFHFVYVIKYINARISPIYTLNVRYAHMYISCYFLYQCECKCVKCIREFVCYLCISYNHQWRLYDCIRVFNNNNNKNKIKSILNQN